MHAVTRSHNALRGALLIDAAASGAMGLGLAVGAGMLDGLLGLPVGLMRWAGIALVPFALVLAFVATRPRVPGRAVAVLVAVNVLWVADSFLLLASGWVEPTTLGIAFVIAQGAAVAVFAAVQYAGLRRAGQLSVA